MALKISQKGWVVIPAELRKKYHLEPGDEVEMVDYGGVIALVPLLENPVRQGFGILKDGPSLTQALLEERKQEQEREQRKHDLFKS
jgi:AbrB family looped-hinge helix DNA binding protein